MKLKTLLISALLAGLTSASFSTLAEVNVYDSMYSPNATVLESGSDKVIIYDVLSIEFNGSKTGRPKLVRGFDPIFRTSAYELPSFDNNALASAPIPSTAVPQAFVDQLEIEHTNLIYQTILDKYSVTRVDVEFEQTDILAATDETDVDFDFRYSTQVDDTGQLIALNTKFEDEDSEPM
ncbi:MAG: hypothetical protein AAGJ37_15775 [Pseudomonadota bacterium]